MNDGRNQERWHAFDAQFCAAIEASFSGPDPWRRRIRAALAAGLEFLAADPDRARFYLVDGLVSRSEFSERRLSGLSRLGEMIDEGRLDVSAIPSPTRSLADAIAGGVWHTVVQRVRQGKADTLLDELPQLMYFIVRPYLGLEAAKEELGRSP